MDRPPRKTKAVNYCESKDFDDDEDFADLKAPPRKKVREGAKPEHKKSSSNSSSQDANSQSTVDQKSRRPLDERIQARELEAAIVLSLLNNEDVMMDQSPTNKREVQVQVPVDENTDPNSLHRSNCSVDGAHLGLDEITSEKESRVIPRQRKAVVKPDEETRKKPTDEDEDYEPKLTPDSDSDDDFSEPAESEDEEFTVKKISKTKKEKVTKNEKSRKPRKKDKPTLKQSKSKTQASTASTPVRHPPTSKPLPKRPVPPSTSSSSNAAFSPSPTGGRVAKWTPPAQIGRSPTSSLSPPVRSPGQGLRLGLSRLVRVKPLHPSVASH